MPDIDFSGLSCGLKGHLCMILSWYWGDEDEVVDGDKYDYLRLARLIKLVPAFVAGKVIDKMTLWEFLDALGCYPRRTPELEQLFQDNHARWLALRENQAN